MTVYNYVATLAKSKRLAMWMRNAFLSESQNHLLLLPPCVLITNLLKLYTTLSEVVVYLGSMTV